VPGRRDRIERRGFVRLLAIAARRTAIPAFAFKRRVAAGIDAACLRKTLEELSEFGRPAGGHSRTA
jgi:hypothetical protein